MKGGIGPGAAATPPRPTLAAQLAEAEKAIERHYTAKSRAFGHLDNEKAGSFLPKRQAKLAELLAKRDAIRQQLRKAG